MVQNSRLVYPLKGWRRARDLIHKTIVEELYQETFNLESMRSILYDTIERLP